MTDTPKITQAARELLADEWEREGHPLTAQRVRAGLGVMDHYDPIVLRALTRALAQPAQIEQGKPKRVPVQVAMAPLSNALSPIVSALCSDGTVWMLCAGALNTKWHQLPPIPQDGEMEAGNG
jgi:hypothetical protein